MSNLPRLYAAQFKAGIERSDGVVTYPNAVIVKAQPAIITKADDLDLEQVLTWVISTEAVDRDDDTIRLNGWDLKDFRKGGSVLWAHNASELPVAKPIKTWIDRDAGQLKSTAQFTPRDLNPFGAMVHDLAINGYVRGASVGFKPLAFEPAQDRDGFMPLNFTKQTLLEWSITPVPSNPEALPEAASKGIDLAPLKGWIERIKDRDPGAALPPDITDGEIEIAYRCVANAATYSIPSALTGQKEKSVMSVLKAHKDAVENLTKEANTLIGEAAEKFAATLTEVAELKAGRVISRANEDKLRKASEMIAEVLAAVAPADDEKSAAVETKAAEPETAPEPEAVVSDAEPDADSVDRELTEEEEKALTEAFMQQITAETKAAIARIHGKVD